MKKIMIIEDDNATKKELKELLDNAGYETILIKDFKNTLIEINNAFCDLILLDINIPYLNGELLLKEIRKNSNIPVIMLTSRTNEIDEVLSISFGADDYITKPYNPTILLLRIQNIFKRIETNYDKLTYNGIDINFSKGILKKDNAELELTKNEMIIFKNLLSNQGKIVTRDELMTDLWNNSEYINDNALSVNISRLRNKLDNFGCKDAIITKKGIGYILL